MTEVKDTAQIENICPKNDDNHNQMTIDDLKSNMVTVGLAKSLKTTHCHQENVELKNELEDGGELLSECSSSDFDPNEYDVIEFTEEHKKQILSLLNGIVPDLSPLQSFDDVNRLYSRLACLMQFFNDFFRVYELWPLMARMPITIRTQKSVEDLELIEDEIRIKKLNHYFRCWLRLFYVCDGIIDSLDLSSGSLEMVAIMILNIFNLMRDSLPQVRRILNEKWLPLKSFERKFQSVLKFDKIATILSEQLVQERIGHELSRQKHLKLKIEFNAKQVELDMVKRNLKELRSYSSTSQQLHIKQHPIPSVAINNNNNTNNKNINNKLLPQQQPKSHLQSILLAPVLAQASQLSAQQTPQPSKSPVVNSVGALPEPEQKQPPPPPPPSMVQSTPKPSTPPIEIETVPDIMPLKIKLETDSDQSEQPASFELPPRKRAPPKRLLSPGLLKPDSSQNVSENSRTEVKSAPEIVPNLTFERNEDNLKSNKKPRLSSTSTSSSSTGSSSLITVLNSKMFDPLDQSIRPKNRKPKVSVLKMYQRVQGNVIQQPKPVPIVVPVDPLKSIVKLNNDNNNNNSQSLLTSNSKINPNENNDGKNVIKLSTPKSLLIRPLNNKPNILAVPIQTSDSDQLIMAPSSSSSSSSMDIITMTVKDQITFVKSTSSIEVPAGVMNNLNAADVGPTPMLNSKNLTCRDCFLEFQDYKSYHAHTYEHEYLLKKSKEAGSKGMMKCQYCIKMFPNAYKLKRHMISHTGLKPFQCEICQKCYTRSDKLREHMKGQHPASFGAKVEPIRLINLNAPSPASTTNQNGKSRRKKTTPASSLLSASAASSSPDVVKSASPAVVKPTIGKLKLMKSNKSKKRNPDSDPNQSGDNNETIANNKNGIISTTSSTVRPSQEDEQEDYFELINIE